MPGFEHLLILLLFILLGGLGMAAMQDGASVMWKHLRKQLPKAPRSRVQPQSRIPDPLFFQR
ncbi:hypothetical protein [Kordiimonas lacus]|jgi:hypothetical protein|uniref:Uncharacterized protein n=1 Tax=Kordiimonas lacus TaxID=637679 RepID=A0A1G7CPB8_9PROT|nr:hypothetical protein [Kordiimonas lacus]SDE41182.1 hypothetical protein SAMN04488071_2886 [Kordiimonas lacus]